MSKNTSGIYPLEYKCLVRMKEKAEKTDGGIVIPEEIRSREAHAIQECELIAIGALAFDDPDWKDCPEVGDILMTDKYPGSPVTGKDGKEYRIINDKEIIAKVVKE